MKVVEVANVDFALAHFILPLMRGIRARGHDVVAVCADGPLLAAIRAEGFRVEPAPLVRRLSPLAHLRAFAALVRLIRRERPDLVHAHFPISGFLARLAARAAGVPHIAYTCHGFLFHQPGPWPRRAASFLMEWLAARVTHTLLTVSEEEAQDARRLRIHPRATPARNGRDPAMFHPDPLARARIRAELGVPQDRPVIIAVSRLVRHKGYPELLAAMAQLPHAELWVVGDRLPSDRGEDLRPALDAAPNIRRLGYRSDVPALLAAADIFTLPSHFEGLPMSIIEAMLTALPVVSTTIRGPREQVLPDVTGLLIPPAVAPALTTALARLIANPDTRAAMGKSGRQRALDRYDESKVVAHTLDLLGL